MRFTSTILALGAAVIPAVHAQSTAAVVNMCKFPVYLWSVSNEQSAMVALPNASIGYQEAYHTKPDGSGVSIKIAPSYIDKDQIDTAANITQFEYTLQDGTNEVWYDISYVNGNAFQGIPVLLQPSNLACPNVTCAQGDSVCQEMYNNPNDNLATHVCDMDANLFFLLCPANSDGASSGSGSSAPSPTPSSGSGVEDVVVSAAGDLELSAAPQASADAASSIGDLSSLDAFSSVVSHWVTYSPAPSKRDEEQPVRHSHREFHERARPSRLFRHSHE